MSRIDEDQEIIQVEDRFTIFSRKETSIICGILILIIFFILNFYIKAFPVLIVFIWGESLFIMTITIFAFLSAKDHEQDISFLKAKIDKLEKALLNKTCEQDTPK